MCTVRLTLMVAGTVRKLNRVCQVSNSRITPDEFKFYFDAAGTCVCFAGCVCMCGMRCGYLANAILVYV